jgi:hypothetical protein
MKQDFERVHKQSKFVFDSRAMVVVRGKPPTKAGQLWKGESLTGDKMELAGSDDGDCTAYWGWSK